MGTRQLSVDANGYRNSSIPGVFDGNVAAEFEHNVDVGERCPNPL
jgi:hypothetical protein